MVISLRCVFRLSIPKILSAVSRRSWASDRTSGGRNTLRTTTTSTRLCAMQPALCPHEKPSVRSVLTYLRVLTTTRTRSTLIQKKSSTTPGATSRCRTTDWPLQPLPRESACISPRPQPFSGSSTIRARLRRRRCTRKSGPKLGVCSEEML